MSNVMISSTMIKLVELLFYYTNITSLDILFNHLPMNELSQNNPFSDVTNRETFLQLVFHSDHLHLPEEEGKQRMNSFMSEDIV